MNNFDIALQATNTSLNSYNSSAQEQEKYNQSLEARVNRLSTAWYGFADAVGQSIVYDGIVVATNSLQKLTEVGSSFGGATLGLSALIGALIAPLTLLSSRFTALTGSIITTVATQNQARLSSNALTASLYTLATGAGVASKAFRGLLAATGVGLIIAGVTTAISLLTNAISENIQEQEQFESYLKKNMDALTVNGEQVKTLISEYENLSARETSSLSVEETQRLIDVQNQLSELYPALTDYVDENGNAHIKSKDAINEEIDITNKLIDKQKELLALGAEDTFKEILGDLQELQNSRGGLDNVLELKIERGRSQEEIAEVELEILQLDQQLASKSAEITGSIFDIADAFTESGIEINKAVNNDIQKAIRGLDFRDLSPEQITTFSKAIADIRVELSKAYDSGNDKGFNSARKDLEKLIDTTTNGKSTLDSATLAFEELNGKSKETAFTMGEVDSAVEGVDESLSKTVEKLQTLSSVQEKIVGVSQAQVNAVSDSVTVIEYLGNVSERTAQQESSLAQSIALLSKLYPQLSNLLRGTSADRERAISIITAENNANQALLRAYELSANGKLTAEARVTLGQLEETNKRIANINAEIRALDTLQQNYNTIINKLSKGKTALTDADYLRQEKLSQNASNRIQLQQAQLATLSGTQNKYATSLNNQTVAIQNNEKASKSGNKTKKDSNSETQKSVYITDEYKKALERLDAQISKNNIAQGKYLSHSSQGLKLLNEELRLQEARLKLMKDQERSIQAQIKSGKILQTGNVQVAKTAKTATKSTSTEQVKVSGFQGRLSSKQGYRKNPLTGKQEYHNGIDLASPLGTRLDSNVSGKVINSKYHNSYGNYVEIQDDKGIKYLFAHLNESIVKLGDTVKAGQQIGTIGSSGASTGAHLHYSVRDAKGNYLDASSYAKEARTGKVTTTVAKNGSTTAPVSNGKQQIDEAESQLTDLQVGIAEQEQAIDDLKAKIIDTTIEGFEYRKDLAQSTIDFEQAKILNVDKSNVRYGKTLDIINRELEKKQKINYEELGYLDLQIKTVGKSEAELDKLKNRYLEVQKQIQELNTEISAFNIERITNAFNTELDSFGRVLEYERAKIDELDTSSARYTKSLYTINQNLLLSSRSTQKFIASLTNLVNSGKYSGQELQNIRDQIDELTLSLIDINKQISDNNYDIIINIKVQSDAKLDDLQLQLDISQIYLKRLKEGSEEYSKEIVTQLELLKKIAKQHDDTRKALQAEANQLGVTDERRKEIIETIEDETLAYNNAVSSIYDLTNGLEQVNSKALEDIYSKVLNAYKDYVQERRDEHMKALEEERKAEDKRHEDRKKQLQDELNLFKKNIQERIEALDRQDAERTYNMDIEDLESERRKIQDRYNLLQLEDTHEANAERVKLQEQLDKIDKELNEKRYKRDLDLQKESLNDLAERKEEEISNIEQAEDERYAVEVDRIDRLKAYYEKYYNDLLNDERKFAQLRDDILNGNFSKIASDFAGYIGEMEATLPNLEDTFDGTMQAVGTSLRLNVIDNLREALKLFDEFKSSQSIIDSATSGSNGVNFGKDNFDNNVTGGNGNFADTSLGGGANASTAIANAKVLVGKYLIDVAVPKETSDVRKNNIRMKAYSLASEGRSGGSNIPSAESFQSAIGKATSDDKKAFKDYINVGLGSLIQSQYLIDDIKKYASSLDTGGYLNFGSSTGGIDGKGGKALIAHDGEVVLNPIEVQKLLEHSNYLNNAFNASRNLQVSPQASLGGNVEVSFFVDKMVANDEAEVRTYGSKIGNVITTKYGVVTR